MFLTWLSQHKESNNPRKNTKEWIGHPHCPLETDWNVKVRVDVRRAINTTYVTTPTAFRTYRKTSFGRLPTTHYHSMESDWVLIEDFVPIDVTTHTHYEFTEILTIL